MKTILLSTVATLALTLSAYAATPAPTPTAKQPIPPHPCGSTEALMCIQYQPDELTLLPLFQGTTVRVEFAVNEFIASVDASNQDVLDGGGDEVPASDANSKAPTDPSVPSCDINLCRHIIGRFLYLQALRPLKAQSLFVTTHYCANGVPPGADMAAAILACPDQSYTLVLDPGHQTHVCAALSNIPDRDAALKAAAARAAYQRGWPSERDRREHMPHPPADARRHGA